MIFCNEMKNGLFNKELYTNNKLHRIDGPAIEYGNGKLHRMNGPAVEYGDRVWYFNGKLHRINGPAIEYSNGDKEWFYEGTFMEEKEYNIIMYYYNLYREII